MKYKFSPVKVHAHSEASSSIIQKKINREMEKLLSRAIEFLSRYYLLIFSNRVRVRVRVKIIYFDKKKHDIEETNTETFMCRSMSATNAYTEL